MLQDQVVCDNGQLEDDLDEVHSLTAEYCIDTYFLMRRTPSFKTLTLCRAMAL